MAAVIRGEEDLLEPLIRRYANPLLTFIRRMIGDHHHSEELFQEVFLTVWKKREQYQYFRPFKPWLFAIAANKVRAYLRYAFDPPAFPLDYDPPVVPSAASGPGGDVLVAAETLALVAQAVRQLPIQQQTVVVLRIWSGLSYAEIAEVINRREGTVRSHMHHGLAALREYLEPRMK